MIRQPDFEFLRIASNYSMQSVSPPRCFIINDINGDGAKDLFLRSFWKSGPTELFASDQQKLIDTNAFYSSPGNNSLFGYSVANLGNKLVITCPDYTLDRVNEGALYVLSTTPWLVKQSLYSNFAQIAVCTDVNGDNLSDLIVSSQRLGFDGINRILIYNNLGNDTFPQIPDTFKVFTTPANGRPVTPVVLGDFFKNGSNNFALCSREKIELFKSNINGLDTTSIWSWIIPDSIANRTTQKSSYWQGEKARESYFTTVCRPADFNGDGFNDLVVSFLPDSNNMGSGMNSDFIFRAFVFFGTGTGLPVLPDIEFFNIKGQPCVGKFNSDTLDDLVISYITCTCLKGNVSIYFGKSNNFGKKADAIISVTNAISAWEDGPGSISQSSVIGTVSFGEELESADLNHDLFDDLIILEKKWTSTNGSGRYGYGYCFF